MSHERKNLKAALDMASRASDLLEEVVPLLAHAGRDDLEELAERVSEQCGELRDALDRDLSDPDGDGEPGWAE